MILGGMTVAQAQQYGTLPDSIPDRYRATTVDRSAYDGAPSAVVRLQARRLVVEEKGEATVHGRRVVTVFEEDGRSAAHWRQWYDSFVDIDDLEGRLLDAEGNEVKDLDDGTIRDVSAIQSFSLYGDTRVRIAQLFADTYPYTVEYRYELDVTSPLRWAPWYPQRPESPTELTQLEVEVSPGRDLRFHVRGDSLAHTKETREERRIYRWRAAHQPSFERVPYGPSWSEQAPVVRVAPSEFEVAGVPGSMSTWASFGKWYHRLKKRRDTLSSPAVRNEMRRLVEGATTRRDSVRRLYRHLQRTTRYVSVQLGIGGWQPFPASYVRERGYGDCKALTNYLEAALDAVGIASHPVLIHRGTEPHSLETSFPSSQFNHVVLAVPVAQDTLWLENTDTTAPFGHVAADIEDRYGLMVTAEGGDLVRTPASRPADNRQRRTATVALSASGDGTASIQTTYTGNQQDRVRRALTDESPRSRREWTRKQVDAPSFDLQRVDFADIDAYQDTVRLPLELQLPAYASKMGSRLFLPLNLMSRWGEVPSSLDDPRTRRVHAVPYPFVDTDTVRYELPSGYDVEALPDPVSLETEFATYEATVARSDMGLEYRRSLEWRTTTLPADRYKAFRRFLQKVVAADDAQAVLVQE